MTLKEIFEKVNLTTPIEQRRFFNWFEDSANELISMYGKFATVPESEYIQPASFEDKNLIRPLYYDAIVENILFLAGAGNEHKSEFIRKSRDAYLKYWNDNAKGRRLKGARW